jgi:hypothetical protein
MNFKFDYPPQLGTVQLVERILLHLADAILHDRSEIRLRLRHVEGRAGSPNGELKVEIHYGATDQLELPIIHCRSEWDADGPYVGTGAFLRVAIEALAQMMGRDGLQAREAFRAIARGKFDGE